MPASSGRSVSESTELMLHLLDDSSESEKENFLIETSSRPISGEELLGFSIAIRKHARLTRIPGVMDIVGTGGDGKNTINVSTAACIVVSSLGYDIVKHGNFGASSNRGSADFLKYLGYRFEFSQEELKQRLTKTHFAFVLAPMYNDSFAKFVSARKNVRRRTVFNYLGPITNPIDPDTLVLGSADENVHELYADFLRSSGKSGLSIRGDDGMDELSPESTSTAIHPDTNGNRRISIDPADITGEGIPLGKVSFTDPGLSFQMTLRGITGEEDDVARFIALNAAPAIMLASGSGDLRAAFEKAIFSIYSGAAEEQVRRICAYD